MTFAAFLSVLAALGKRHKEIGRAALTGTGEAPAGSTYPLLLVEADPLCEEMTSNLDVFSVALQVLDRDHDELDEYRPGAEDVATMLTRTKQWADELLQQLRDEHPGWLDGKPVFAGLPQCAGSDLATGWRIEMRLKIPRELNRASNAALFDAAELAPIDARRLNDFSPAEIIAGYLKLGTLAESMLGNTYRDSY